MTNEQKDELKAKIESELKRVEQELEAIKPKLYPIKKDCSIDKVEHKAMKLEQNIAMYQFEELKRQKNRLTYAMHKLLNDINYGICKECEEEIDFKRLLLIPYSEFCVECLEELK